MFSPGSYPADGISSPKGGDSLNFFPVHSENDDIHLII